MSGEETLHFRHCFLRILFGKEMAAGQRAPPNLIGPLRPDSNRSAPAAIPTIEAAATSPKRKYRADDSSSLFPIGSFHLEIDAGRGPIFLTDGMSSAGSTQSVRVCLA